MDKLELKTSPICESVGNYVFILDFDNHYKKYRLTINKNDTSSKNVSENDLQKLRLMLNKVLGFEKIKLN